MTASKMESECRVFAAESFKCLESYGTNRAKAKDECAPFFDSYKDCLKRESDAAKNFFIFRYSPARERGEGGGGGLSNLSPCWCVVDRPRNIDEGGGEQARHWFAWQMRHHNVYRAVCILRV
ncbi:unnamed protein product [Pylaiella littoralis]